MNGPTEEEAGSRLIFSALGSILLCSHSLALSTSIYLLGLWRGPGPVEDVEDRAQRSLAAELLSIYGGGKRSAGPQRLRCQPPFTGGSSAVSAPPLPAFPQASLGGQSAPMGKPT